MRSILALVVLLVVGVAAQCSLQDVLETGINYSGPSFSGSLSVNSATGTASGEQSFGTACTMAIEGSITLNSTDLSFTETVTKCTTVSGNCNSFCPPAGTVLGGDLTIAANCSAGTISLPALGVTLTWETAAASVLACTAATLLVSIALLLL